MSVVAHGDVVDAALSNTKDEVHVAADDPKAMSALLTTMQHPTITPVTRHSSFSSRATAASASSSSPLTSPRPSSAQTSAASTPSSASLSTSSQPVSPRPANDDERPLPALSHLHAVAAADDGGVPRAPSPPSPPLPSARFPAVPRVRAEGYVGLLNQGATCYLNSLLQSLFFTAEFREALLFRWEYVPGVHPPPLLCIPYQLQLLFARLLCSVRPAVETAALTKSFRWTDAESFRQHDIQELMRVLFAALEKTLGKNTKQQHQPGGPAFTRTLSSTSFSSPSSSPPSSTPSSPACSPSLSPSSPLSPTALSSAFPSVSPASPSFVHQLYCGQLVDYITCLSCHNRRQRLDEFMDLSLDVADCATLEEALRHFVQSETLTGDNRWRCDQCKEKVEARKGLTFHKLPPILTIQLKRFVFDFTTHTRSKLQHRVTFPDMIDMAAFGHGEEGGGSGEETASSSSASPAMYDLFAVLMHSGTANGGHYFSYIRTPHGPFLEFNDTNVWNVPEDALEQAYGGGKGACAYMLIYRARDLELAGIKATEGPEALLSLEELEREGAAEDGGWRLMRERGVRSAEDVAEERRLRRLEEIARLPASVKAVVDGEDALYLQQHAEQERERRRLEVTVVHGAAERTFQFDQEQVMADCLRAAGLHFGLPADLPIDRLRFRRYDRTHQWTAEPYPTTLTLAQCHFSKRSTVQLETRGEGTAWPAFNPNVIPVRVIHAHAANLHALIEDASSYPSLDKDAVTLSIDCTLPLSSLSTLLQPAFTIPGSRQRLIRLHDDKGEVLSDVSASLQSLGVQAGHVLYVEDVGEVPSDGSCTAALSDASASPLCQQLDLSKCQLKLLFNLPLGSSDDAATTTASEAHEGPSYEQAVHVSRHQTVGYLKSLIAPVLSLPPSSFRLSRNESSPHFKDLDATLARVGLVDYSAVHVSVGRQCEKHELNLRVFLLQSAAPTRTSSSFLYLFDLPIASTSTVQQLKVALLAHLNAQYGDVRGAGNGLGLTWFRVRDKKGNVSARVFEDGRSVGEVLSDEAELCVERCDSEEESRVKKESILLRWAWWDGRTITGERELLVKKMVMVAAIRDDIRTAWRKEHSGPADDPAANVDCPPLFLAKGLARVRMRKADVEKVHWLSEDELPDTKLVKNLPLRLAAGDLLLATTIPPPSHALKARASSIPDAPPEAPALDAVPPPPPPPPLAPPCAPSVGAASVSVNKPPESVISAAKSRLRRSVGGKGLNDGVLVKGARIYPTREYGLSIEIEDEVAAIERACAEADRAERERASASQSGQQQHAPMAKEPEETKEIGDDVCTPFAYK